MKKRRRFLFIFFFLLAAVLLIWISGILKPKPRPNIVLIIIDALRADKLGCYGFPTEISPEIDALAQKGVLFEKVISQCSWTRPSIGSMLTSLHPRSTGIYKEKFDILQDKYLTLAEILKDNGYRTFGITANPNINKVFGFHQGFDEYEDSDVIWKWMKPGDGQKINSDDAHLPGSKEIFTKILERVKNFESGPVYIQVNIMDVHSPFHLLREEYKETFKDYPVRKINVRYSQQKLVRLVRETLAAVRQSSADIGRFVEELHRLPGWENTLFVITSDHGQGLDDHPDVDISTTHGNLLYESHLNVPLIFYQPGKEGSHLPYKPHRVKTRVRLLDVLPTILDYARVSMPGGKEIHGTSLLRLITGGKKGPQLPPLFVAETYWRQADKIAVYSNEWKYIENRDDWKGVNKRELQPMGSTENGRLTDKIAEHAALSKKMKNHLAGWERKYERAARAFPKGALSKKEIEQLKSLGYLK
jgi:arylsulfatase A-like enzyme